MKKRDPVVSSRGGERQRVCILVFWGILEASLCPGLRTVEPYFTHADYCFDLNLSPQLVRCTAYDCFPATMYDH